jgi:methyl coenzyme M reductase system subunit A2
VDFVKEVSHRAILMENGALIEDGDPIEICNVFLSRCNAPYLRSTQERYAIHG